MDISAVIVAYRSSGIIGKCLEALHPLEDIIVVDNAQDDDLERLLKTSHPHVRYIRNPTNEGFGCAANHGIAAARHELVLLVNPDAVLSGGCIEALSTAARNYPEAALLAPTLYNSLGKIERSHDTDIFHAKILSRQRIDPAPDGDICAGYLSDAVLLIRRTPFQAIGGFDPAIFLFYEDDDICMRLRARGHALVLVHGARANHVGGASSSFRYHVLWRKHWHFAWSRLYIEEKYNGSAAAWREGVPELFRRIAKALLYVLSFNRYKAVRDTARVCGSLAALFGVQAQPKDIEPDSPATRKPA